MKECTNCLMNTSVDPHIRFDEKGMCHYCLGYYEAHEALRKRIFKGHFRSQIEAIRGASQGGYDCILGVSGGTDSSYVAYLLKKENLKVLMVHCDNGWDTELAVENLEKIRKKTGFDLLVRKLDTDAFYQAQKAFIKARIVDIELLSDHVNVASIYETAHTEKIPWVVTGENINTEYFMPPHWVHNKNDWRQIQDINKRFGKTDMKTFPKLGPYRKYFIDKALNIRYFKPLNSINYDKERAGKIIHEAFGWEDHGGKHFESYFTIFFQCYILPEFFNIDKRIPHLSNLICSSNLPKKEAKAQLAEPILSKEKLAEIKEVVFSKLGLTEYQFQAIMAKPSTSHADYKSYFVYKKSVQRLKRMLVRG
ncbi:MAG: N-acetyl sugar amidotransferase [Bacteroidia bacterium]